MLLAMALIAHRSAVMAVDASKPDAASIMNAMYAAVGVGNVDAAVSFFADDGYNIGPSGKKTMGKEALLTPMRNLWIPENVQIGMAHDVKVQADKIIMRFGIASKWCDELGASPAETVQIVTIEGSKIKSVNGYYTSASIDRMMQACAARPDSKMPNGAPSGKGIPILKKYTDELIVQGIAESEGQ